MIYWRYTKGAIYRKQWEREKRERETDRERKKKRETGREIERDTQREISIGKNNEYEKDKIFYGCFKNNPQK